MGNAPCSGVCAEAERTSTLAAKPLDATRVDRSKPAPGPRPVCATIAPADHDGQANTHTRAHTHSSSSSSSSSSAARARTHTHTHTGARTLPARVRHGGDRVEAFSGEGRREVSDEGMTGREPKNVGRSWEGEELRHKSVVGATAGVSVTETCTQTASTHTHVSCQTSFTSLSKAVLPREDAGEESEEWERHFRGAVESRRRDAGDTISCLTRSAQEAALLVPDTSLAKTFVQGVPEIANQGAFEKSQAGLGKEPVQPASSVLEQELPGSDREQA